MAITEHKSVDEVMPLAASTDLNHVYAKFTILTLHLV